MWKQRWRIDLCTMMIISLCIIFVMQAMPVESQKVQTYESKDLSTEWTLGGIVPHHTVAQALISDFYEEVAKDCQDMDIDVVLLISPNHSKEGYKFQMIDNEVLLEKNHVSLRTDVAEKLLNGGLVHSAPYDLAKSEHGQWVETPYINYYFQDVGVIGLMINETRTMEGIQQMADQLIEATEGMKVLVIGSIDFSHYLTYEEAEEKDAYTEELLMEKNISHMIGLSNDYIDGPSVYALMMTYMNKRFQENENYQVRLLEHSNSAVYLSNPNLEETTSYFTMIYGENW